MATSTRTVSVGKVGFVWKGVYSATTAYTVWDTFLYNNSVYLCIADASAGISPDNTSYFTCVSHGLVGKGEYNPASVYDINSIVTNNNVAYIAKEGGITGVWDSTKWMPIPTYIPQSSVGISYVTTEADNDLVALWNLFNSSSLVVDGTQTTYGMTSVDDGSIITSLTPTAPVFDCEATYQMNPSQPFSRLPIMDIPSLAMTNGDAITISFLKWCGANAARSAFYPVSTSNILNTSLLEVGQHGFHFEDLGSDVYLFVMHQDSASSLTYDMVISARTNSYFNINSLNDLTFTIQRTATQYIASVFVNGNFMSSNTINLGDDTTGTKFYLGNVGASARPEYLDDRGLVQIAVYSGVKYTGNYTPTYALLKKTV
jgi:hypothetical protein